MAAAVKSLLPSRVDSQGERLEPRFRNVTAAIWCELPDKFLKFRHLVRKDHEPSFLNGVIRLVTEVAESNYLQTELTDRFALFTHYRIQSAMERKSALLDGFDHWPHAPSRIDTQHDVNRILQISVILLTRCVHRLLFPLIECFLFGRWRTGAMRLSLPWPVAEVDSHPGCPAGRGITVGCCGACVRHRLRRRRSRTRRRCWMWRSVGAAMSRCSSQVGSYSAGPGVPARGAG